MIASTQTTNTKIFTFTGVLIFESQNRKILFINKKGKKTVKK